MLTKDIKYLVISDIHLGHTRTPTNEIIEHFNEFFDYYKTSSYFTELDIIFIAGDLFDRLLEFSDPDTYLINVWISLLVKFCSKHNIKLRILHGTPSHDWNQSKIVQSIIAMLNITIDYAYIQNLHIEHMRDLNLTILYVPDEWSPKAEDTLIQVKALLRENHLNQVDIAIMHGMFEYQGIMSRNFHDASEYLSIVKYYINIGHIHTFSSFERILAQGSFDRLSQNEEEPKGGILVSINKNESMSFEFIENKQAKTYITVEFRSKDIEKCFKKLEKILSSLRKNSHVRIKTSKDHPFYNEVNGLKLKYSDYYFTRVALEDNNTSTNKLVISKEVHDYEPINIQEDNIKELLLNRIKNNYLLSEQDMVTMEQLLDFDHD